MESSLYVHNEQTVSVILLNAYRTISYLKHLNIDTKLWQTQTHTHAHTDSLFAIIGWPVRLLQRRDKHKNHSVQQKVSAS